MSSFPIKLLPILLSGIGLAWAAPVDDRPVTETIDPVRVAAVEQAVRDLQRRQGQQAPTGGALSAASVVSGSTDAGIAYLSGGITVDDREQMRAQSGRYGLWIATVAKGSGAYLSDAQLRIVDSQRKSLVLARTSDGPWFMLALPPGRYTVSATLHTDGVASPETLTQQVTVPARGQHQAVLRFKSPAQVSPEMHLSK